MNINLHIERLILDAVDIHPGQRHLLRAALETELARLLMEGTLAPRFTIGVALPRITTPGIQIARDHAPTDLGEKIAAAVYGGIGHD